jgi:hypothetical protein
MGQMVMNQSRAKVKARKAKYKYIFCIKLLALSNKARGGNDG